MQPNIITFKSKNGTTYFHIDFDKDVITISQLMSSGTSKSSVEIKYSDIAEVINTINDIQDNY